MLAGRGRQAGCGRAFYSCALLGSHVSAARCAGLGWRRPHRDSSPAKAGARERCAGQASFLPLTPSSIGSRLPGQSKFFSAAQPLWAHRVHVCRGARAPGAESSAGCSNNRPVPALVWGHCPGSCQRGATLQVGRQVDTRESAASANITVIIIHIE